MPVQWPHNKPTCYVANPLGFAESTRMWYYEMLLPALDQFVSVLNPWGSQPGSDRWANPRPAALAAAIEEANDGTAEALARQQELSLQMADHHYDTIEHHAQLLVAVLDQEPPDNGTICEVVWAAAHGVPVIGYRNDFRSCGDPGMLANLMIEGAIRRSGGFTVRSLEELTRRLPLFLDVVEGREVRPGLPTG